MKYVFSLVLAGLVLASAPFARAQSARAQFQPGEWQINSTVNTMGRSIQRQTSVCARSATGTWTSQSPNEKCSAPTLTPIANGYHVTMECSGGNSHAQWKSSSSIDEIFSDGGKAFDASGKTTSTVAVPGNAPMTMSATIHSVGKRTGDCK